MLALARALLVRPSVLLVDEMSAGLAPTVVKRLFTALAAFTSESGMTMVLVEQHARLALAAASKVLVLAHGRQAFSGDAAHIRAHPEILESGYLGGHK